MDKVYIFGHKKPDTDAVCGAIALSYLKNKMGFNAEPRILSEINSETAYALKKFNVAVPRYLNDVKVQIKDVKYRRNLYLHEDTSIYRAYEELTKKEISGIPIVDDKKKFVGYAALKEITKTMILGDGRDINTSFNNLAATLQVKEGPHFRQSIQGQVKIVTLPYRMFINAIELNETTILVTPYQENIINHAINCGVKLIVIIENGQPSKEILEKLKNKKIDLLVTHYDVTKVAVLLSLANPIKDIKREEHIYTFEPLHYLTDFLEATRKLTHTNYPIVNGKGICEGMLQVINTHHYTKKKVILVDHNEPIQSIDGLNEAEIIEIVDHHNIGTINTNTPINFRNMAVGSVNTIIYYLYLEQQIRIPKDIAGLMLSGIISDTLLLVSPTTTDLDRLVAESLAKTAKVNLKAYGLELLQSGVSINGLSPFEVVYKDFKSYIVGDYKIGIAQVFATSFKEYEKDKDTYISCLNDISINNNYKVVCLFVTDIINNNSYLLFNESAKKYLEDAYGVDNLSEGYLLEGVVSRKKQMIPLIMDVIEKI